MTSNKPDYICDKCGKKFMTITLLNRHMLKKKIPCNIDDKAIYSINKRKCKYCDKILCTPNNLKYHDNICKKKPITKTNDNSENESEDNVIIETPEKDAKKEDDLEIMRNQFEELKRQMELQNKQWQEAQKKQTEDTNKLLEEINKLNKRKKSKISLSSDNNNNNIINNSNNNSNNSFVGNINNFNITAYGKETCDHISDNMFKKIIDKGFKSVPYLVEQMHFNKDKPENHNVYISNMRDNYVLVYDGTKWILNEKETILEDLRDEKSLLLSDKYEELKNNLGDYTKEKFERFLDESDSSKVKEHIKNDIKITLYNNKSIPEATRQQIINKS